MTTQSTRSTQPTRVGAAALSGLGEPSPRVLMKPRAPKTGYVDGAWWPYSRDLVNELPGLITALTQRLGPALRVDYYLIDWETPTRALVVDGQSVRLDWHGYTPAHTIELIGTRNRSLVVLVVPPGTEPRDACATMTSAAAPNGTPTVNELLGHGIRRRRERAVRKTAARNWAERTTSSN